MSGGWRPHKNSATIEKAQHLFHQLFCQYKLNLHCFNLCFRFAGHEVVNNINGHGEDDGRVVLCRDAAQRLEVAQLRRTGHNMT